MSEPVLLYGQRDPASVSINSATLDTTQADTVVIPDAEIFYSLFEIRMRDAEAMLPPSLHPSVPALLGISLIHANDGPLGRFTLAYSGIACRTGIKPRHFIQSAFCSGKEAGDFFSTRYGFPCRPAEVESRESYDRIHATVQLDQQCVLDISAIECLPLVGSGATVKYSPPLNATVVNGDPALVQFEAAYEFKRVLRGRPQLSVYDAAILAEGGLLPTTPVTGTFAVVDLHLLPVRFEVDVATPAEKGGARKIAR